MTRLYLNHAHDSDTTGWYSGGYEETLSEDDDGTRYARVAVKTGGIFNGNASSYTLPTRWYSEAVGVAQTVAAANWSGQIQAYHNDSHSYTPTATIYLKKRTAAGSESTLGTDTISIAKGTSATTYTFDIAVAETSFAVGDRVYLYISVAAESGADTGSYHYAYYERHTVPTSPYYSYIDTPVSMSFVQSHTDDSLEMLWNTTGEIADTLTMRWNVTASLSDDLDTQWHVYTELTDSLDIQWHTLQMAAEKALDMQWNTESNLAEVYDDVDVQWHVYYPVTDSLDMQWNTQIGILESVVTMELSLEKYTLSDFTTRKHTESVFIKEA